MAIGEEDRDPTADTLHSPHTEKGHTAGEQDVGLVATVGPTNELPSVVKSVEAIGVADTVGSTSLSVGASAADVLPMLDRERYEVSGEVGRGGLGRVLRARDRHLGRNVAIKELLENDESAQRRFVREAMITARLQHPSIVPIYDAGQAGEGPFYAMQLVAGRSLDDAIRGARTLDARLALLPSVIAVTDAMAYAHEERVIHRDLKPGNVLVGKFGETVVIDWGLAKDLTSSEIVEPGPYRTVAADQTVAGSLMGTPAYMAPEQARGADVDERADVYALGALLYHVLCGKAPHAGPTLDDMLRKVVAGELVPLREREPGVPVDLAAIVEKAMQLDPEQRYPTAKQLSEDLHRFQTGQLVNAHHYSARERMLRWLRRRRGVVAVVAVATVVFAVFGLLALRALFDEQRETAAHAERAERAAADAIRERDSANANALLVRAQQYARTGHVAEEIAVLRALASGGPDARRLARGPGGLVWKSHERLAMALGKQASTVARSSDGTRFVAVLPGAIVAWDVRTGKELGRLAIPQKVVRFPQVAAISPNGRFVMLLECDGSAPCGEVRLRVDARTWTYAGALVVRELTTGRELARLSGSESIGAETFAFASDDSAIAIARDGMLRVLTTAGPPRGEHRIPKACHALAVAQEGAAVAVACGAALLVATGDDAPVAFTGYKPTTRQLVFVGHSLVAIGEMVQLWYTPSGELRGEATLPEIAVVGAQAPLAWTNFSQNVGRGSSIRLGVANVTPLPTSLLAPFPLITSHGAILPTTIGWVLSTDGKEVSDLLVSSMMPPTRTDHCLPFAMRSRHAVVVLDDGARLLVDEQELPARRPNQTAALGYRTLTTNEAPFRQLRPARAAESDACLVWGNSSHTGIVSVHPTAHMVALDEGLLVLQSRAVRIAFDGSITPLDVRSGTLASERGDFLISFEGERDLMLTAVATNRVVRRWPVEAGAELAWVARDVAEVRSSGSASLVPVDPALPIRPREPDLVTTPRSSFGVRLTPNEVIVIRMRDGVEHARHRLAATAAQVIDDQGTAIVQMSDRVVVLGAGARRDLVGAKLDSSTWSSTHLVNGRTAWDLRDGRKISLDLAGTLLVGEEVWWITEGHDPQLNRLALATGSRRAVPLSTAGIAFQGIRTELLQSPDRRRVTAGYHIGKDLPAVATWDAETGDLLWIGSAPRLVGDWVIENGRAYRPQFDLDQIVVDIGKRTNLRVCRDDLRAVAVTPLPSPDTIWAPVSACRP